MRKLFPRKNINPRNKQHFISLPALLLQQNNHIKDPELVPGTLVLPELLHTLEIKKKINFK